MAPLRAAGEQCAGEHEWVVVDVDYAAVGGDPLADRVGVVRGGQAGPDIQELADTAGCQLIHRADQEAPQEL